MKTVSNIGPCHEKLVNQFIITSHLITNKEKLEVQVCQEVVHWEKSRNQEKSNILSRVGDAGSVFTSYFDEIQGQISI